MHFPREHRRRLHSTNPIERLHKEIKRRTRVVGIFPTRDSLMRMVGAYRHLDALPSLAEAAIFEETEPFAIVRSGLPG